MAFKRLKAGYILLISTSWIVFAMLVGNLQMKQHGKVLSHQRLHPNRWRQMTLLTHMNYRKIILRRHAIIGYCCNCIVGLRTVGCCSHVMSIVWYLAYARHLDNISPPAQVLDGILVFEEADSMLLEPVMSLEVVCPESHAARVLTDLTRRRAEIRHIQLRHQNKVIECLAPLSELLGYSTTLRSLSSGLASFSMEFHSNRQMAPHDEEKAIRNVTGF